MIPPQVHNGEETVFGMQDKARNVTPPVLGTDGTATFTATVVSHSDAAGHIDVSGPFVHGKPGGRFLYLGWRPTAGPADNWIRRWKIRLSDLPSDLGESAILTQDIPASDGSRVWIGDKWQPSIDI